MKNTAETTVICPNCGRKVINPAMLITADVVNTSPFKGEVEPDEKLRRFIISYGGIIPPENQLKQIVIEHGKNPPEFLKKYLNGNKLLTHFGEIRIKDMACNYCHNNLTPLYTEGIEKTVNVILVGPPGSSKTSILKTIFKMITENYEYNKSDKFQIEWSSSLEFHHYFNLPFPVHPTTYMENTGLDYRQPLFYCKVNKTLLIFHDYPGERIKIGSLYVPDNAIPVYLFDPEKCSNEKNFSEHIRLLSRAITSIHDGGRRFQREHLLYTKCDMLSDKFVKGIMLKPYELSNFKDYSGLYAARCFSLKDKIQNNNMRALPIYYRISTYCKSVTVSCLAAYGVKAEKREFMDENEKLKTEFFLKGSWNPQYIYDFLLNLTI